MIVQRPLTIADIFDRSVTIIVRRWRVVVALSAIAATPSAVIMAVTRGQNSAGSMALDAVLSVVFAALAMSPLVRLGADTAAPPKDVGALLRQAVRDYRRSLGAWLLAYAILVTVIALGAIVVAAAAFSVRLALGPSGYLITAVVGGLMVLALLAQVFLVTTVAYANVILEQVGPWRGLTSAVTRCRHATGARTWLVGGALLVILIVPAIVSDSVLQPVVNMTGLWGLLVAEPYLTAMSSAALGLVAGGIVAVDYRNRYEGADLHALLDAAPSVS